MSASVGMKYSCRACGVLRVAADVPARGPTESTKEWVDGSVAVLALHHRLRFPDCKATEFQDLLIPVPPTGFRIGDAP